MANTSIISKDFYLNDDVIKLSQAFLGKSIETNINQKKTIGMIVETEAYAAPEDRASHAFKNKITKRNKIMFADGGIAYVYLCYGIHTLFNIVTNKKSIPHAILIRAIEPLNGISIMEKRRNLSYSYNLTSGPGKLTQALGISIKHNGLSLMGPEIIIREYKKIPKNNITVSPRVGIEYAGKDVLNPWRFRISGNKWCSK